jgi:hypothetical protein
MSRDIYRYTFDERNSMDEIRDSLFLAIFSAEGIHGEAQVRLDAAFRLDEAKRACALDGSTAVGQTIARVFTWLLTREFGEDAFTVERNVDLSELQSAPRYPAREEAAR